MNTSPGHFPRILLATMLGLAGAIASALVFSGWMRFGPEILLTFSENALSFCF